MKRKGCQSMLECNIRTYNAFRGMKREKGITLIALIVTIIVLLILAGISIGALTGDNGILGQSKIAKEDTERKGIEEQMNVMVVQSTNKRGNIDKEKLIEKLNTLTEGKEIVESDNKIYVVYPEYSFEIDLGTGDVTQPNIEMSKDETPWELAGSGTESDPYLIESIEDLVVFSNSVNGGKGYTDQYVKLVNTLDFNLPFSYNNPKTKVSEETNRIITENENGTELKTFLTSGTGFNPIGNESREFRGTFDGNGKEIRNIYINRPEENYVSFFGRTYMSEVNSLEILGNIIGNNYVSMIVAMSSESNISNCMSDGKVSGKEYVAGILGTAIININVEASINKGEIKGNNDCGGIVGILQEKCIVSCCFNIGNIVGEENYVGGIVGFNCGKITNVYNIGNIEINKNFAGGIVGNNGNDAGSNGEIIKAYNYGNIKASKYSGGISGENKVGESGSSILNGYNKGKIQATEYVGGINGKQGSTATTTNCYYLKGTAPGGINSVDAVGQAEPLEESEMPSVIDVVQNQIEVNGETINAWKEDTNNINNGYPILYWQ